MSPFSCVVYFVNKTVSMAAPWGTDSPISVAYVTGVTQQQRWAHEMALQIVKNPGNTVNAIGGGVQPVVGMPGMVGVAGSPMTTINTKNTEATSMPELLQPHRAAAAAAARRADEPGGGRDGLCPGAECADQGKGYDGGSRQGLRRCPDAAGPGRVMRRILYTQWRKQEFLWLDVPLSNN